MTRMLANTIRALTRFFNRDILGLFKARQPVEVALSVETTAALDRLKARYSIEITLPAEPFFVWLKHGQYLTGIEGQPATSEEANWYVPSVCRGVWPLPASSCVKNTKLNACRTLRGTVSFAEAEPGRYGSPAYAQRTANRFPLCMCRAVESRTAQHGVLYLSVTWGRDDEDYVRKLIHHEFYHCVQRQQFGGFGDPWMGRAQLAGFCYGPGGLAVNYGSDRTFWVMPAEEWGNGFLNQYSMSAPEEDQAEIFAHLLTEPAVWTRGLRTDDILRRKLNG